MSFVHNRELKKLVCNLRISIKIGDAGTAGHSDIVVQREHQNAL